MADASEDVLGLQELYEQYQQQQAQLPAPGPFGIPEYAQQPAPQPLPVMPPAPVPVAEPGFMERLGQGVTKAAKPFVKTAQVAGEIAKGAGKAIAGVATPENIGAMGTKMMMAPLGPMAFAGDIAGLASGGEAAPQAPEAPLPEAGQKADVQGKPFAGDDATVNDFILPQIQRSGARQAGLEGMLDQRLQAIQRGLVTDPSVLEQTNMLQGQIGDEERNRKNLYDDYNRRVEARAKQEADLQHQLNLDMDKQKAQIAETNRRVEQARTSVDADPYTESFGQGGGALAKIGAAIAIAMGQYGSMIAGGPNTAMQILDGAVKENRERKMARLGDLKGLGKAQQEELSGLRQAYQSDLALSQALEARDWNNISIKMQKTAETITNLEQKKAGLLASEQARQMGLQKDRQADLEEIKLRKEIRESAAKAGGVGGIKLPPEVAEKLAGVRSFIPSLNRVGVQFNEKTGKLSFAKGLFPGTSEAEYEDTADSLATQLTAAIYGKTASDRERDSVRSMIPTPSMSAERAQNRLDALRTLLGSETDKWINTARLQGVDVSGVNKQQILGEIWGAGQVEGGTGGGRVVGGGTKSTGFR